VSIRRSADGTLWVLSASPVPQGEVLTLDLESDGSAVSLTVRVDGSDPVLVAGSIRHRLSLTVLEGVRSVAPACAEGAGA
jgi:hypothetical protein